MSGERDDHAAMCELAADLPWTEAARFIRAETGDSLIMAVRVCENIARQHPGSVLGTTFNNRYEA